MSVTINDMELVKVDSLFPDQLEIDDYIKVGEDIVQVVIITEDGSGDNYFIECENEFGERDEIVVAHDQKLDWYFFTDED
jgi:hypothetical protein